MSTQTTGANDIAELRAQFAALLAEVKVLRAEAGAGQSGEWGKQWTARGHPDRRLFPEHPGVNPEQPIHTGKELENIVLDLQARITKLEGA